MIVSSVVDWSAGVADMVVAVTDSVVAGSAMVVLKVRVVGFVVVTVAVDTVEDVASIIPMPRSGGARSGGKNVVDREKTLSFSDATNVISPESGGDKTSGNSTTVPSLVGSCTSSIDSPFV